MTSIFTGGKLTYLLMAADILADEIARTEQQLPQGIRHGARTDAPKVHHALADAMPCYQSRAATLAAARAEVALELVAAVLAAMLVVTHREGNGRLLPLLQPLITLSDVHIRYKGSHFSLFIKQKYKNTGNNG